VYNAASDLLEQFITRGEVAKHRYICLNRFEAFLRWHLRNAKRLISRNKDLLMEGSIMVAKPIIV
jgi:hypothetical protein